MEIGDRIRRERHAAGLTQVRLAELVGVDKSAVAQWETPHSRKGITTANLIKVAAVLAVPVSRLTGDASMQDALALSDRDIELVKLFRRMTPAQQDVHLELFRVSVGLGIGQRSEAKRDPAERKRITR